jgi:hypothetical protein
MSIKVLDYWLRSLVPLETDTQYTKSGSQVGGEVKDSNYRPIQKAYFALVVRYLSLTYLEFGGRLHSGSHKAD